MTTTITIELTDEQVDQLRPSGFAKGPSRIGGELIDLAAAALSAGPATTIHPPKFHGSDAVMCHGDELWHFELGRGKVKGWRYDKDGGKTRVGIVATWENWEGELLTWIPSIRHEEIKASPPPPTTVTIELTESLASDLAKRWTIVPTNPSVDLWRVVEGALRRAIKDGWDPRI